MRRGISLWCVLALHPIAITLRAAEDRDADRGTPPPQTCEAGESPDIIVADVSEALRYGTVGGITAYSFGLRFCNPGTCWVNFFFSTNQHPVISHNIYRLKDGRFEHIGLGWVQHTFFALSQNFCFTDCQPTDGTHLGVHCSDVSSASIQGQQSNLGPRSQINASTGEFPFPFSGPPIPPTIGRRVQVHNTDLDPALNHGAIYFAETLIVAADDAVAGNGENNASHRRVNVGPAPTFNVSLAGATVRESPAIHAWKANGLGIGAPDPAIEEAEVAVPGDGAFLIAAKATDLGNGSWRYEYAMQNLNSHRAGRSFRVPLPAGAVVQNAGFHDVDYHSGEPYDMADWSIDIGADAITWSTESFDVNENANALRWGTLYNFRFDANVAPGDGELTLGLFRPGVPDEVTAQSVAPAGIPSALITRAMSRKPNPATRGTCDINLLPEGASEPRSGGITEVRVGFEPAPGHPLEGDVVIEEATCPAPTFVPYSGSSALSAAVEGQELVLVFSPGLENGRSYRISFGNSVTTAPGQSVGVRGLLGDVNSDRHTDGLDRSVLVGVWTGTGFSCPTDLDSDGLTTATDRSLVVGAWTGAQNCAP